MTKTKKSTKKSNLECRHIKNAFIAFCFTIFGVIIGALICSFAMKDSNVNNYLRTYPYLLTGYLENSICPRLSANANKAYKCEMIEYGITEDGNPYMRFSYQAVDTTVLDHPTFLGEKQYRTVYFWQDESKKDQPEYYWGFSESFGD